MPNSAKSAAQMYLAQFTSTPEALIVQHAHRFKVDKRSLYNPIILRAIAFAESCRLHKLATKKMIINKVKRHRHFHLKKGVSEFDFVAYYNLIHTEHEKEVAYGADLPHLAFTLSRIEARIALINVLTSLAIGATHLLNTTIMRMAKLTSLMNGQLTKFPAANGISLEQLLQQLATAVNYQSSSPSIYPRPSAPSLEDDDDNTNNNDGPPKPPSGYDDPPPVGSNPEASAPSYYDIFEQDYSNPQQPRPSAPPYEAIYGDLAKQAGHITAPRPMPGQTRLAREQEIQRMADTTLNTMRNSLDGPEFQSRVANRLGYFQHLFAAQQHNGSVLQQIFASPANNLAMQMATLSVLSESAEMLRNFHTTTLLFRAELESAVVNDMNQVLAQLGGQQRIQPSANTSEAQASAPAMDNNTAPKTY